MVSKKILTAIGIVVLIVLVLLAVFALPLITESSTAVLTIEQGSVQVAQSPLRTVTGDVALKQGDTIKTGPDGKASVVLFGSSVVRLDSNTEINFAELQAQKDARKVSIDQKSGRVWSRVIKLSGVENYQVNTPRSVAAIRGTGFDSRINPDGTVDVSVVDGTVRVTRKTDSSFVDVGAEQAVTVGDHVLTLHAIVRDDWIKESEQKDKEFLIKLREMLKSKYWAYVELAKAQYKLTDQQVDEFIDGALIGKYSQDQIKSGLDQIGIEIKP